MKIKILDDLGIPYVLKCSRGKRLSLKISKNQLVIHYPFFTTESEIEYMISLHLDWIQKYYHAPLERKFIDGETYLYLGKPLAIKVIESKHEAIIVQDENLLIYTRALDTAYLTKLVDKWLMNEAQMVFDLVLQNTFVKMKNDLPFYPSLKIKHYQSRWGVCYPKQKCIYLNVTLMHAPLAVIEYVVIHELSHLVYLNHQSDFHQLVNKYCDEKAMRKELKKLPIDYR